MDYAELPVGEHEITDAAGVEWIVTRSKAGWTERPKDPSITARTIWPYEFVGLLTDDQLSAVQLSTAAPLIRMRTKVQTLVSPMPFDETSELFQGVQFLGKVMPDLFPAEEVARILAAQLPG